jgi:hypothetical protein
MQPTRLPNPGRAAHKSSPTTLNYLELLRSEREAANAMLGSSRSRKRPAQRRSKHPKCRKPKPRARARVEAARRVDHNNPVDTTHYAQQPFYGDYRPMY